jgi:hypothetical protein
LPFLILFAVVYLVYGSYIHENFGGNAECSNGMIFVCPSGKLKSKTSDNKCYTCNTQLNISNQCKSGSTFTTVSSVDATCGCSNGSIKYNCAAGKTKFGTGSSTVCYDNCITGYTFDTSSKKCKQSGKSNMTPANVPATQSC